MPTSRPATLAVLAVAAASAAAAFGPAAAGAAERPYTVLAINACDRAARCHGDAGARMIDLAKDGSKPNVLAVNEVCEKTADRVAAAAGYHKVFTPAGKVRCGSRGRYGNALLLRGGEAPTGAQIFRGRYRTQGRETRTLTCVTRDRETCVTHLDPGQSVARRQAKQLKSLLARRAGGPPTLLAGDLNLNGSRGNRARPAGWWRKDDGARMHVLSEAGTPSASSSRVPWTDHPILRVEVR